MSSISMSQPNNPLILDSTRLNPMGKFVYWLHNKKTSTLSKIAAVVLPVLAAIALGLLLGHPILVPLLLIIPPLLWAVRERICLKQEERSQKLHQDFLFGTPEEMKTQARFFD